MTDAHPRLRCWTVFAMKKQFRAKTALLVGTLALGAVLGAGPTRAQDIEKLYAFNCAGCHGPQGKGNGPSAGILLPPPGDFHDTLKGRSDEWIARVIEKGGAGGNMAAVMPAYGGLLTEAQIKALVAYIKRLR